MNKIDILEAKIEFCRYMLEYKSAVENNYKSVNNLNEIIELFKELGILNDINISRSDTIMNNKLMEIIKVFEKFDIDPLFFYNVSSNDYYPVGFLTRYVMLYLSDLILEMHNYLHEMINDLYLLTGNAKKLSNNLFKIVISTIRGGNMISENKDCQEKIEHIREEYRHYQDKLNELHEFDIKKDYLDIVKMNLHQVFIPENASKIDFQTAIFVHYNMWLEYLNRIGRGEDIDSLRKLYIDYIQELNLDLSVLDGDLEPYFTNLLPESEEILQYAKLNSWELANLLFNLESQRIILVSEGELTGDAPKDIANLMLVENHFDEQEKKHLRK